MSAFAAVDIGASSGRVMVGRVGARGVELAEAHRFANVPVRTPDGLHWDVLRLFRDVLDGLRAARALAPDLVSIGIDTWAVDFGLLDAAGELVGNPRHYRDARHASGADALHAVLPADELYALHGLQLLPFTTIYQLAAARGTPALRSATALLMLPDLFAYWLTGRAVAEVTNASTTGLLDVTTRTWSAEVAAAAGVDPGLLPELVQPGAVLGPLLPEVAAETGLAPSVVVTAVGSHDTASAVVAVPATDRRAAYVSCGTWSLVGVELDVPVLTPESREANFTNEGGVDGRVRYLRNVMGLWLLSESLRTWADAGDPVDLAAVLRGAADVPAGGPVVDPDDPRFLPPGDLPARIAGLCRETDQPVPDGRAALVRCILDSLAAAYARAVADAVRLSGREVDVVHLVGGGARNQLLCQLTADACGLPVLAGPAEATALGNLLVQARAHGAVSGTLEDLRALLRRGERLQRYEPFAAPAAAAPDLIARDPEAVG